LKSTLTMHGGNYHPTPEITGATRLYRGASG
jgi:hypothetical protein